MAPATAPAVDEEEAFFADGQTYDRQVTLGKRTETVTLRPLMAGDKADIQDEVRISLAGGDNEDDEDGGGANAAELRIGAQRILVVSRAIVGWTLPKAVSVSAVRSLNPKVFDQIYAEVSWGKIPAAPEETPETPLDESSDSSAKPTGD